MLILMNFRIFPGVFLSLARSKPVQTSALGANRRRTGRRARTLWDGPVSAEALASTPAANPGRSHCIFSKNRRIERHPSTILTCFSGNAIKEANNVSDRSLLRAKDARGTKILDFGLARRFRAERPFDSARFGAGTLPYKAPEQIDSALGGEDYRTDVHALGVILFQLFTEHLPYPVQEGTTAEYKKFILEGPRLVLDDFDKSIDSKLQKICARAMAVERARRYDSPAGLAAALEGWLRWRASGSRNRILVGISVVICLAMAVAVVVRKAEPGVQWRPVAIMVQGRQKPFTSNWNDIWSDLEGKEAWLCGGDELPIAGKYVGPGFLLHTSDGGRLWEEVAATNFTDDSGILTGFEGKKWKGIGPIRFVDVRWEAQADGQRFTNGWIAGITGVYLSSNAGSVHGKWNRITPPPDVPEHYAYFEGLIGLNNYQETLAFGWQGIAHSENGGPWDIQMGTLTYSVNSVTCTDGENKDFWAVTSRGGMPSERGHITDCGAVYHYDWPGTNWALVPLQGIALNAGQSLIDIVSRQPNELFVVGSAGLIMRGSRAGTSRLWKKLPSNTDQTLISACEDVERNLWVVGADGIVLKSTDDGESWVEYPCFDEQGKRIRETFHRIRFFGRRGWIVGDKRVMRCELP
jgi:hypothetical protein